MTWLPLHDQKELDKFFYHERPTLKLSCDACSKALFHFTDLEPKTYSSRCPNCGHVIRITIRKT